MIRIKLDRAAVREVPQRLVTPLIRKATTTTERGAKQRVRVKTGAVKNSIGSDITVTATKVVGTVRATHRRSMLEHEGSPRHIIRQRPGGPVLTFYWPKVGSVVRFTSVNHPGTKGSKFLTEALRAAARRHKLTVSFKTNG